jgi:hypothetical protein
MLVKPLQTSGGAVDAIYRWMNEGTTVSLVKVSAYQMLVWRR